MYARETSLITLQDNLTIYEDHNDTEPLHTLRRAVLGAPYKTRAMLLTFIVTCTIGRLGIQNQCFPGINHSATVVIHRDHYVPIRTLSVCSSPFAVPYSPPRASRPGIRFRERLQFSFAVPYAKTTGTVGVLCEGWAVGGFASSGPVAARSITPQLVGCLRCARSSCRWLAGEMGLDESGSFV